MAKTIKKLDLKRETVRSLRVKAGIMTGLDPVELDHIVAQGNVQFGLATKIQSVVSGLAAGSGTRIPASIQGPPPESSSPGGGGR